MRRPAAPIGLRHAVVCTALYLAVWSDTVTVPAAAEPDDQSVDLSVFVWADPDETAALLEELGVPSSNLGAPTK